MFADDVMLVGQATEREAEAFLKCLNTYCKWSGQAVNFQKSTIFSSKGVPQNRASKITNALGMRRIKKDTTYLGIPLLRSTNKSQEMKYLVDKVNQRIEGWKSRLLSKAGRTCLIQAVGASLPIYAAASGVIPTGIAWKIDNNLRDFWWGKRDQKKPAYTISWNYIFKSKFNGGQGMRQTKDVNKAFLLKWGWKLIIEPSSLWSETMQAKYLKGNGLFEIESKSSDSDLWKSIMKNRKTLQDGICRKIGYGCSRSIWFGDWVPTGNRKPRPLLDAIHGVSIVKYFINDNLTWNERKV